jgi:predicted Zn-dependent peptidase
MLFEHKTDLYTKDNLIIVVAGKINNLVELKKQLGDTFGQLPDKKRINKPEFKHIFPEQDK